MRDLLFASLLIVATGCSRDDSRGPSGPLVALVERPTSGTACGIERAEYVRPFWRAPYQRCRDSVAGGYQSTVLDADSVVVEAHRSWIVAPRTQPTAWDREAERLIRLFGKPVHTISRPEPSLPPYCAAWRGPDSAEITLRLQPTNDVGPIGIDELWEMHRNARYGPLPDAVACGLR